MTGFESQSVHCFIESFKKAFAVPAAVYLLVSVLRCEEKQPQLPEKNPKLLADDT